MGVGGSRGAHRWRSWSGCEAYGDGARADLERLLTFVSKHPGLRIEQINKQLGTTTKDLALPIRKLIADGAIKTKGEKRSTTYFATVEDEL